MGIVWAWKLLVRSDIASAVLLVFMFISGVLFFSESLQCLDLLACVLVLSGIGIMQNYYYEPVNFGESIYYGYKKTIRSFGLITLTFQMLGSGQATLKDLGGPIMIGQIAGETAKAGWQPLFNFMALISINLAFLNILPIPGLDGGHIFLILIESIIRRPLSLKSRMVVQQIGMVFLLVLMVTIMFNDVTRLFN